MNIPFGNIPINRGGMPPVVPAGININPGGQFRAINTPGLSGAAPGGPWPLPAIPQTYSTAHKPLNNAPGMLPAQYSARASGQSADKYTDRYADISGQSADKSATNVKLVAIACAISAVVTIIVAIMFYYIAIDGYAKVPLPLAGQENYVLTGNGGWQINNAITVQNDVTSSRAIGKVYRNTTGKTMYVMCIFWTGSALWNHLQAFSDSNADPAVRVAYNHSDTRGGVLSFWVIPNNYYKVINDVTTATVSNWIEWY